MMNNWKRRVNIPLIIDLYIYYPKSNQLILLERWNISFQQSNIFNKRDMDRIPSKLIERRIQTLLRTIHCFVRLLPGYYLIQLSKRIPQLSYQIYSSDMRDQSSSASVTPNISFPAESKKYTFPQLTSTNGILTISIDFLNSTTVKEIIKYLNEGTIDGLNGAVPQPIRRDSRAIPIPISQNGQDLLPKPIEYVANSPSTFSQPVRRSSRGGSGNGVGEIY